MVLREIVEKYLKDNGHSGLVNTYIECGCGIGDLFLCESPDVEDCEAAREITSSAPEWRAEWSRDGANSMFIPARKVAG